ncbi:protein SLX4IP isoform X1 [Oryzias melastigma]|uniref:SLX4 interacting protein n=2 Tax=Oryzias melastigma TaxID=30732 RepID=A0A3B3CNN7_ORYME|nr:protein SLX4IP isoform X1 [Oryzias melastigma]XP_024152482.1 protein SLX4IP isoform X1 [Oryzias melastigma]XP_036071511.1 protein SLX4IP isoform X1 [Oryzias melastigma]
MAFRKIVIKCGNFAVLVDLHVLPLGSQKDASWFTAGHVEEVTTLVQEALDQRIRQYTEFLHSKKGCKQRREMIPPSGFSVRGENFNLVANFLKRHSNLRCVVKQDLRLFPERYVVCVSAPEDALLHHRNPSLVANEVGEQSRSEYFSRVKETQELLSSSTNTKKSVLQKIVKQIRVQQQSSTGQTLQTEPPKKQGLDHGAEIRPSSTEMALPEANHRVLYDESEALIWTVHEQKPEADNSQTEGINVNEASSGSCQHESSHKNSKRCKPSDSGEDHPSQQAKRTCLERSRATTQPHSTKCSSQASRLEERTPLPPAPPVQAKAESTAFLESESKKTTVEVELLTPEKQTQISPPSSKNTAQRNQNMLATSLRGLSVKPTSTDASIGSRSMLREKGSENVPRASRLRRQRRF